MKVRVVGGGMSSNAAIVHSELRLSRVVNIDSFKNRFLKFLSKFLSCPWDYYKVNTTGMLLFRRYKSDIINNTEDKLLLLIGLILNGQHQPSFSLIIYFLLFNISLLRQKLITFYIFVFEITNHTWQKDLRRHWTEPLDRMLTKKLKSCYFREIEMIFK